MEDDWEDEVVLGDDEGGGPGDDGVVQLCKVGSTEISVRALSKLSGDPLMLHTGLVTVAISDLNSSSTP